MSQTPDQSPLDRPDRGPQVEAPATPASAPVAKNRTRAAAAPPKTRISTAYTGLIAAVIVLVLLLVFILENTKSVKVSYFGANGHLPLGVALLLAAVGGALLVGIIGAARIFQVRRHAKRLQR